MHADATQQLIARLVPTPHAINLQRLGGDRDGAYLVPADLKGIGACFSPGVANRKAFEDDLAHVGIRSHMADWSSDESLFRTPLIPDFQTFKKKWIVPSYETNADSISLGDWVDAQEPGQGDLMLQMDIEGNEYGVLSDCSPSLIKRFRIILIELHGLRQAARPSGLDSSKRNALQMLLLHHTVIHVHPNNAGGIEPLPFFPFEVPSTLEVTAVRSDWLSELTSSIDSALQLPHELDIAWNTSGKPPLFLNKSWCGGTINESCQQRRDRIMESWEKSRAKRA